MGDPGITVEDVVVHSVRHTSAGVKLRLSKGDPKAVQGDGGWNTPDMHIFSMRIAGACRQKTLLR